MWARGRGVGIEGGALGGAYSILSAIRGRGGLIVI